MKQYIHAKRIKVKDHISHSNPLGDITPFHIHSFYISMDISISNNSNTNTHRQHIKRNNNNNNKKPEKYYILDINPNNQTHVEVSIRVWRK